jgi:hypothetical protein
MSEPTIVPLVPVTLDQLVVVAGDSWTMRTNPDHHGYASSRS